MRFYFPILLFVLTFTAHSQNLPPKILVEGTGLNTPSGITGTISIRVFSLSTGFDKSVIVNASSPSSAPANLLPTTGGNYKITITNNTNKQIGYVLGQIGGECTGKPKGVALGNGTEINYRNGFDLPIEAGQIAEVYADITIQAHPNYQQTCTVDNETYELGGIYLSLFKADVNRLRISEDFLNTQREFYIYNIPSGCNNFGNSSATGKTQIFINGAEYVQKAENVLFDAYGLRVYRFPEGYFNVGDIIWAEDECGSLRSNSTIVEEDYAYLSISPNNSFAGNGIAEDDTLSPASRLETPLRIKQCVPISNIGSHNLSKLVAALPNNFPDNQPYNVGKFYVNGQIIKPDDFITRANAYRREVGKINADGSVSHFGGADYFTLTSRKYFVVSPSNLIVFEYQHNGFDLVKWDFAYYIILGERFGFRFIHNNDVVLRYINSAGDIEEETLYGDFSNARYKITFDGTFIRLYINNALKREFRQKVSFSSTGGILSDTNYLDLHEKVNFMPTDTGYHQIRAKINNIQVVSQKIYIEPNKPVIFPNQDSISIYKGQSITLGIQESSCQGTPLWSTGSNQFTIQVSPIVDTEYSVTCQLPNNCTGTPDKIKVIVLPPVPSVFASKSEICLGEGISLTASGCTGNLLWSNGMTSTIISVTPTLSTNYSVSCNVNGRTSPSKIISIKIQ
ncbi:hypothetical protein [Emticicia oligotrophica]|uniref:hypothetical protein n=1 Tax=Emticicia oligotrophica TaxID=312279 RepID=UPI00273CDC33|nr:hypothetical protein [Emticicia oligotrophica]